MTAAWRRNTWWLVVIVCFLTAGLFLGDWLRTTINDARAGMMRIELENAKAAADQAKAEADQARAEADQAVAEALAAVERLRRRDAERAARKASAEGGETPD